MTQQGPKFPVMTSCWKSDPYLRTSRTPWNRNRDLFWKDTLRGAISVHRHPPILKQGIQRRIGYREITKNQRCTQSEKHMSLCCNRIKQSDDAEKHAKASSRQMQQNKALQFWSFPPSFKFCLCSSILEPLGGNLDVAKFLANWAFLFMCNAQSLHA